MAGWERFKEKWLEILEDKFRLEENARIARKFHNHLRQEGIGVNARYRYIVALSLLDNFTNKSFENINKEDLEAFFTYAMDRFAISTVDNIKTCIKRFYKWFLGKDEEYPSLVKWIKKSNRKPRLERSQLITEDEFKKMVQACDNVRDRAILWILYECGLRVSELTSLKIGDFEMLEDGLGLITVRGKTGSRSIPVALALPDLLKWLERHPLKDDPQASLFITRRGNELSPDTVQRIVKKHAKRAGIKKRVYPHLLRHSRATMLASQFKEPILRQFFGWSQGSRTPEIYLHLSTQDVIKSYAQHLGLKNVKAKEPMKPKTCPRCGEINPPDSDFCSRCGHPFDEKFIAEKMRSISRLEDELKKRDQTIAQLQNQVDKLTQQLDYLISILQGERHEILELYEENGHKKFRKYEGQ